MTRGFWLANCVCCGVLLAGCASGPATPPEPQPRGTTLRRYHEDRVTIEELAAARESALACAHMIALMERELREPWVESRDARVLTQHTRARDSVAASIGFAAWENAEAGPAGSDRRLFNEFGVYGTRRLPGAMLRRAYPANAEDYAQTLLAGLGDDSANGRLLSGWRHLAPEVSRRAPRYIASSWRFTVGLDSQVELRDSLLGPYGRCAVVDAGSLSGLGPLDGLDDFQMPREILDILTPGAPGELASLVAALARGGELPRMFKLAPGRVEKLDSENAQFLAAALRGLNEGICDLEYLPAGVTSLTATFSYLLDTSEARAAIGLRRDGVSGWMVESFHYEPAGASMLGQRGAKLDLMPLLRAKLGT